MAVRVRFESLGLLLAAMAAWLPGLLPAAPGMEQELTMPPELFKRLDQFEAHNLSKADSTFGQRQFQIAWKDYDAFIKEFPRSKAVPYAIFRKARCLHLDEKRYQAIKTYNEVLDFFPNIVEYAAPALYFIGIAYWDSGDKLEAHKAWAEMAEDKDYCKHDLAGDAINRLAGYLVEKGEVPKAMEYYERVGEEFRRKNPKAAEHAIRKAIAYYIRSKPDEPKLRELYRRFQGFWDPIKVPPDLSKDWGYWDSIRHYVSARQLGQFGPDEQAVADRYWKYWAQAADKLFLDKDDFRIEIAGWHLAYERSNEKWFKRLDDQFESYQKEGDSERILKWISLYAAHKNKVTQYYQKLDFAKLSQPLVIRLMTILYDQVRDPEMARNVFRLIRLDRMSDGERASLARYFWDRDWSLAAYIYTKFDDTMYAKMETMRYWHRGRNVKEGLPLADELVKEPKYAEESMWCRAEFLYAAAKYEEAIASYRQTSRMPDNLWAIVSCYKALRQLGQAVAQLGEIENFVPAQAARARFAIAQTYNEFGQRPQYIVELRNVLMKYPKSGESSQAHRELEALGETRIKGGEEDRDR